MKTKVFGIYLALIRLILKLIPIQNNKITILNRSGYAGSNGLALYQYLKQYHVNEIEVQMINNFPSAHLSLKTWLNLASSKFIFGTHDPFKISKKQIYVQLWHGIPLKRMGYLAQNVTTQQAEKAHQKWQKNIDFVASSSDLYETLMSACLGIEGSKFIKTGFPRNDLFELDSKQEVQIKNLLIKLISNYRVTTQTKFVFYLPTFRLEDQNTQLSQMLSYGNIFGLEKLDLQQLEDVLESLDIVIVTKLHPIEAKQVDEKQLKSTDRIFVLNDTDLQNMKMDLYSLLAISDALITDYSSVYFDYLLMDKPLIFLANDLKAYQETRGFLLSPYKKFAPGDIVVNAISFIESLQQLESPIHRVDREDIKQMVYPTDINQKQASENIWEKVIKPNL